MKDNDVDIDWTLGLKQLQVLAPTLSGSVKLRGKATQPEFDGQLKVRGGEFGFKGLPGGITDVEIDVVADENEARVTRASGHFLGGDVGVTARMPLKGGSLGIAEATVTGRQLYVSPAGNDAWSGRAAT